MDAYANVCFLLLNYYIVNSMKTRHVSKVDVFQRTCMFIRHMKKEIPGSHCFSSFALSNLLTRTGLHFCTTGQLFF